VAATAWGSNSEVGTLRAVILHRPGPELQRLTPRNSDALLFDGLPWVARAQEEHDAFAELLRSRGVEVMLLADLLTEALTSGAARMQGIAAAVDARRLGHSLAQELSEYLRGLDPSPLARVLMAGMTFTELPSSAAATSPTGEGLSLVRRMHHGADFVIDPLPNLLFTRDSSIWIGPRVAITSLALPARMRETSLTDIIYAHHPRFTGVRRAYESHTAPIEGGDVLRLAPGVVAVGVGERTSPAGAEALARSLFDDNLAHTVLAVPIGQERAQMHLDTVHDGRCRCGGDVPEHRRHAGRIHRQPHPGRCADDRRRAVRRGRRQRHGHRPAACHRHRPRSGHRRTRTIRRRQ
jgi:arginine deiminase